MIKKCICEFDGCSNVPPEYNEKPCPFHGTLSNDPYKTTKGKTRNFDTGATRDTDEGKYDYEGFLCPLVIERYGEYMNKHRTQSDGKLRDSDNWKKGIPQPAYMKSGYRHFFDWWKEHRGYSTKDGIEEALCALMFNTMGYLHEHLKKKGEKR